MLAKLIKSLKTLILKLKKEKEANKKVLPTRDLDQVSLK